jgi:hypothetical protein
MLHLFDNIYVKADKLFLGFQKRIVISEEFGDFHELPCVGLHEINETTPILPLLHATSYQKLLDTQFGGSDDKFFQYLLGLPPDDRIVIYCDPAATLTIATKFWKTLYPTMSADMYIELINYHFTYQLEILGIGYLAFTKIRPEDAIDIYDAYLQMLSPDNVENLTTLWGQTTPWRTTAAQRDRIIRNTSIELQLASTMVNPQWKYASETRNKIAHMMKNELIREYVYNIRFTILHALVDFKIIEPTTTFDIFQHSVDDLVLMHPEYKFLTDPRFLPKEVDYVFSTYDMETLRQINNKVIATRYNFEINWDPLFKQDLSYEDIIAYELESPTTRLLFRYGDYKEYVIPYIVDALLDGLRDGTISHFAPLELK